MERSEATVGTRVKTLRSWASVPLGAEGVIDEDYGTGITVAWDRPDRPLPAGWKYEGQWAVAPGVPLRDGFCDEELVCLEVVK